MSNRLPVTVCIPTRNAARDLPDCLSALGDAFDRVVVVDSQSLDATNEIAKAFGAECIQFRWTGGFPKKRNWFLRHGCINTPWILFLDADERVTEAFIKELRAALRGSTHVGFWVGYDNRFMRRTLKHGDPFRKLILFRPEAGEYERFPEDMWCTLDMEVHEHPVLSGSVGVIKAKLVHEAFQDMESYAAKHVQYAAWEARRHAWLHSATKQEWTALTRRQQFKYQHLDKWWFAPLYFAVTYVGKLGFLDGYAGLRFACFKCWYFRLIRGNLILARSARGHSS